MDPISFLLKKLIPLLAGRSAFGPIFHKRIIISISSKPKHLPVDDSEDSPFFEKLSAAYSDYRYQLLTKLAGAVKHTIHNYPEVVDALFPDLIDYSLTRGIAKVGSNVMESLVGVMPVMYLNRAYFDGPVSKYIDTHSSFDGIAQVSVLAPNGRVA